MKDQVMTVNTSVLLDELAKGEGLENAMETATIKQFNSFGREINVTKDEFVQRWTNHASEFRKILHIDRLRGFLDEIKAAAEATFDEIHEDQTKACIHAVPLDEECEDCTLDLESLRTEPHLD